MKLIAFILVCLVTVAVSNETIEHDQDDDIEYSDEVIEGSEAEEEVPNDLNRNINTNFIEGSISPQFSPQYDVVQPELQSPIIPQNTAPIMQQGCSQLIPNYCPYANSGGNTNTQIPIPPVVKYTTEPVRREETVVCPIGTVQVGNICQQTLTKQCLDGYTYDGHHCVIKYKSCPMNFELNSSGNCIQRQICPSNHVYKNGRCEASANCQEGWRWNGVVCEIVNIQCSHGSVLRGNECIIESFTCPIGYERIGDRCKAPEVYCQPGYTMQSDGFCAIKMPQCKPGSFMVNGQCQRVEPPKNQEDLVCPIGTQKSGNVCKSLYPVQCPGGYKLKDQRCIITVTTCPLDFEKNQYGVCEQRQICPHNFVWRSNRCEPLTDCPAGWKWNGDRCDVINIQCNPGLNLRGTECVKEDFTCPLGYEQRGDRCIEPKPYCAPGYTIKADGFCSRITQQCESGSYMNNGQCQRSEPPNYEETRVCPIGSQKSGNVCKSTYQPKCSGGYTYDGHRCVISDKKCPIHFEKDEYGRCVQRVICPQTHVLKNGRCEIMTDCPVGSRWTGIQCEIINVECQQGTQLRGSECVAERTKCPVGFNEVNGRCEAPEPSCPDGFILKENGFCSQVKLRCHLGTELVNGECRKTVMTCPPGSSQFGNQCYKTITSLPAPGPVQVPQPCTTMSCNPCIDMSSSPCQSARLQAPLADVRQRLVYPGQVQCPVGFSLFNNQCFRCPQNYHLCQNRCVRNGYSCDTIFPSTRFN